MELAENFKYVPQPPVTPPAPTPPAPSPTPTPAPAPAPTPPLDLGSLKLLLGTWKGSGFNAIWRPAHDGSDRFLELNLTNETIEFAEIPGNIPNRGLLQDDLEMRGIHYLQQITDAEQGDNGLHVEAGVWLRVPATTNPLVSETVARLGTIPHGTSIVAQGICSEVTGPPPIPAVNINPFTMGSPAAASPFSEQTLATPTAFRTPDQFLANIDQALVNNPNSLLQQALQAKPVTSAVVLQVATNDAPAEGGGAISTAFLAGGAAGPNAVTASVTATFWIETLSGASSPEQLQYSQTVLLNFNGINWPHVTVATLHKQ